MTSLEPEGEETLDLPRKLEEYADQIEQLAEWVDANVEQMHWRVWFSDFADDWPGQRERLESVSKWLRQGATAARGSAGIAYIRVDPLYEFAQMAAAGVVGTYAYMAHDRLMRKIITRWGRKGAAQPTVDEVRALGRYAINQRYDDVLPATVRAAEESIDSTGWRVVFDLGGERYIASGALPPRDDDAPHVSVERSTTL